MIDPKMLAAIYKDEVWDDDLTWGVKPDRPQYYSYEPRTLCDKLLIIREKEEPKKMNNTKESSIMKNVLFLAPGYAYAKSVISNQSKELDRKKIPYNASTDYNNLYIHTDKVSVELVYMDPIKYTPNLFKNRDAVFGKRELISKAEDTLTGIYIKRPAMSLSAFISKTHAQDTVETVEPLKTYIPEIKNAYFNNPMTVVMWEDGTKTMIKCQDGDTYSAETGLALCIAKKALGNMPNFNNVFKKWIPEEKEIKDEQH